MFKKLRTRLYIKSKIREANRLFLETGKRYFVIRVANDKLMVVNNEFLKEFNKLSKKKVTCKSLSEHSIYYTR